MKVFESCLAWEKYRTSVKTLADLSPIFPPQEKLFGSMFSESFQTVLDKKVSGTKWLCKCGAERLNRKHQVRD